MFCEGCNADLVGTDLSEALVDGVHRVLVSLGDGDDVETFFVHGDERADQVVAQSAGRARSRLVASLGDIGLRVLAELEAASRGGPIRTLKAYPMWVAAACWCDHAGLPAVEHLGRHDALFELTSVTGTDDQYGDFALTGISAGRFILYPKTDNEHDVRYDATEAQRLLPAWRWLANEWDAEKPRNSGISIDHASQLAPPIFLQGVVSALELVGSSLDDFTWLREPVIDLPGTAWGAGVQT